MILLQFETKQWIYYHLIISGLLVESASSLFQLLFLFQSIRETKFFK